MMVRIRPWAIASRSSSVDAHIHRIHDRIGCEPASALRLRGYRRHVHEGWTRGPWAKYSIARGDRYAGVVEPHEPQYAFAFALAQRVIARTASYLARSRPYTAIRADVRVYGGEDVVCQAPTYALLVSSALSWREGLHANSERHLEDSLQSWCRHNCHDWANRRCVVLESRARRPFTIVIKGDGGSWDEHALWAEVEESRSSDRPNIGQG